MEIKDKISLVVSLMIALGGTLFATIAIREHNKTGHILQAGVQTQGMVVEMGRRPRKVGERVTPNSFAPVVQFTTDKGEQRKYYSTLYSGLDMYKIGQMVDIWYLPNEPEKATMAGGDAWILSLAFSIFGLVMCLIGYPWLFKIIFRKLRA
ncbi:MAG: DUF3592 domain-containing protein [Bacteroidetes bacterium]|nr:DUF3592 domain-containing protein [Bacteroidota bacterium]